MAKPGLALGPTQVAYPKRCTFTIAPDSHNVGDPYSHRTYRLTKEADRPAGNYNICSHGEAPWKNSPSQRMGICESVDQCLGARSDAQISA